jgi:hypothetical protein
MLDTAFKPPAPRRLTLRTPTVTKPAPVVRPRVALALASVLLTGCESADLSRSFGFVRDAPDEYTVTTQQPLSMPPEFAVRPPAPGTRRPQDQTTSQQALQALSPQSALTPEAGQASPGQEALVQASGPAAPSNIRARVNGEATAEAQQSNGFVDKLMFWRAEPPVGIVVDPTKEAQRIRENAALGRTQDAGDTPIIQPRKKGWLEGLF